MAKIPLSWSRIQTFRQCPYKFKEQFITKTYPSDDNNPAFVKGIEVHKQVDTYIKTKQPAMLGNVAKNAQRLIDTLHNMPGTFMGEIQVAVNDDWQQVDWFDKNPLFRAIFDALYIDNNRAILIDWKTGKVQKYDEERGQLHLATAILFELHAELEQIKCSYNFLEHGQITDIIFSRKDHTANKASWELEALQINSEEEFAPKKNKYCNWCLSVACPLKSG